MDWQWIANGLFVLLGILGTAFYNSMKKSMEDSFKSINASIHEIEDDTEKLTAKVQAVELLVAGNYVHKDDLEKITAALFRKLDQICDKLDRKADK